MSVYKLQENGDIRVVVEISLSRQSGRKMVLDAAGVNIDIVVVTAFARARRWQELIDKGRFGNIAELASKLGHDQSYVARIVRLNSISPKIVSSFLRGKAPSGLSLGQLCKPLPVSWEEQEKKLGFK
jgi:hypothetical protein